MRFLLIIIFVVCLNSTVQAKKDYAGELADLEQDYQKKRNKLEKKLAKQEKKHQAKEAIKLNKDQKETKLEDIRAELKENEEKALDFIFPSIEEENWEAISRENFFSNTEKEQLLELWRATLARNRTIQFIIRSLSTNPDDIEKNNAVMQTLSRALFIPFYAVSAVANDALVSGGSLVGARVIGDVVDADANKRSRTRHITRTDTIVLFMLVDEIAERLRKTYYSYKEAKMHQNLISYEIEPAKIDAAEALNNGDGSAVFFTRMVLRDLERRQRESELNATSHRRTLVELAGNDAVDSVDVLIKLEVKESIKDIIGV